MNEIGPDILCNNYNCNNFIDTFNVHVNDDKRIVLNNVNCLYQFSRLCDIVVIFNLY